MREKQRVLREQADPAGVRRQVDAVTGKGAPGERDLRGLSRDKPGEATEDGRLARAVRPEQREHRPGRDAEFHGQLEGAPGKLDPGVEGHRSPPSHDRGRATAMTRIATTISSRASATALSTSTSACV